MRKLLIAVATVSIVVAAISLVLILPKYSIYAHELTVNLYTNGAMDFSVDATSLVRSLGIISLMTLVIGLTIGAAMGLGARVEKAYEYEKAIEKAGLVKITNVPDGIEYRITEYGRRFLRDYAFLNRGIENLELPARNTT